MEHLTAYEAACVSSQGGAYLRSEGLFSSQITEWRKLRDAGVWAQTKPGERVGEPSAEQAEIARLRRNNERLQTWNDFAWPLIALKENTLYTLARWPLRC